MAYPQDQKRYVLEEDAQFVGIVRVGIPRYRELTRQWDKIKDKQVEACVRLLENYTSADNVPVAGTTPLKYFVTDPKAVGPRGLQTYEGNWRIFKVSRTQNPDRSTSIVQVLREGFQQHSGDPDDPLSDDESRISVTQAMPNIGVLSAVQEWRYTDPADHEEILADFNAIKTITDPVIEGETVTGLFSCSKVEARPNEDGSVRFSRVLTQIFTVDELSDLTSMSPIITQKQEIINAFGFESGIGDTLMYVYKNLSHASRTFVMETLTAAQLETIPASHPTGDWVYVDREFNAREDGTGDFVVIFREMTWDASWTNATGTTKDDQRRTQVSHADGYQRSCLIQVTGMDKDDAITDFQFVDNELTAAYDTGTQYGIGDVALYTAKNYICINPTTGAWTAADWVEAEYLLGTKRLEERARGEFAITAQMRPAYAGTTNDDAVILRWRSSIGGAQQRLMTRVWWRRSEAAKDTLVGTGGVAISAYSYTWPGDGAPKSLSHADVSVDDHGDGAFTVRQTLIDLTDTTNVYWTKDFTVKKVQTRTKDDAKKTYTYTKYVSMKSSEDAAWNYIDGLNSSPVFVVAGTESVVKVRRFYYKATALTLNNTTGVTNWT